MRAFKGGSEEPSAADANDHMGFSADKSAGISVYRVQGCPVEGRHE